MKYFKKLTKLILMRKFFKIIVSIFTKPTKKLKPLKKKLKTKYLKCKLI